MIETVILIELNKFHCFWAGLRTRGMNAARAVSGIVWPDRCVSCGSALTLGDPRGVCRDCLREITIWPRNTWDPPNAGSRAKAAPRMTLISQHSGAKSTSRYRR